MQGNYFLFIELTSQLHRTLVPIPVWLFYLLDHNDRIPAKVLGVILTAAYMVFKGKSILKTALAWKVAASKLLQSTVSTFFFVKIVKVWPKSAKFLARLAFLDHNDRIPAKVLGVILTVAYMVFKGKSILKTVLAWKVTASKLLQSTVSTFVFLK